VPLAVTERYDSQVITFRLVPALVLAAAIAFACGPRSHSSEAPERTRTVTGPSIVTTLDVRQHGHQLAFTFRITNNAKKKLELVFPSGHTHDLTVVDASGEEVWRWSEGRMFTQALQNRVLGGGDTLSYEMMWSPPAASAGSPLTAIATLRSENHPLEQRTEFSIP
jgi:hypothetical protein